jgi:hypothetical protein
MHKALSNLPTLDSVRLAAETSDWKKLIANAKPGGDRIVVEWGVSRGPMCFVYPVANRAKGIDMARSASHAQSDERWADFLEFDFLPQVERSLEGLGFRVTIICADLRPIQIMRERRRVIEATAHAKTSASDHH